MHMKAVVVLAATLVGGLGAHIAAADELTTGTAVYELSLDPGKSAGSLASLSGRMESGLLRVCDHFEGWNGMDAKVQLPDGREVSMAIRSTFTETENTLRFDVSGTLGSMVVDDSHGLATRTQNGISIVTDPPASKKIDFAGGEVLFPVALTNRAIAAARAGDHLLNVFAFDGSKSAVWPATAVIGDARSVSETDSEKAFAQALGMTNMEHWPMKLSYFLPDAPGDSTPSFSMDTVVYATGFSLGGVYNFGKFAMRLELVEFKPAAPKPCS